jgi:phage terminase small subunit
MLKPRKPELPPAPRHLRLATRAWFAHVLKTFELDEHHVRLLTLAAEAWDRGLQAKEALKKSGLTFVDRFGSPRARPEVQIERDSRISFARLIRELDLDGAIAPPSSRPPALNSNRR